MLIQTVVTLPLTHWFVFLKPLPPGDHTLYYNVGVTGTGPNDHSAEITYDLKVK